jgi:AcrR family transcriptional regulator
VPRVSEEHLDARRGQILDGARRAFARNGFHSTSMQDILRESGLSAGAVYRYFPSKDAIIAAIATEAMATIRRAFETSESLTAVELIAHALERVEVQARKDDLGRLALQVYAEAARSEAIREEIAAAVQEAREALRRRLEPEYGDAAGDAAAVLTALLPGYIHARTVVGDMDPGRFVRGIEALIGPRG